MPKQQKPVIPTTTTNVQKSKRTGQLYQYQAYKYPLFPTPVQEREFRRIIGSNRWLRKHFIAWDKWEHCFETNAGFVGYDNGFQNDLTPMRNNNVKWLADVSRPTQVAVANDLVDSFSAYFKGDKGKPKFKGKDEEKQAFTFVNGSFNTKDGKETVKGRTKLKGDGTIRINRIDGKKNREIHFPSVGWVKLRLTRELPEKAHIIDAAVSCKNGQWYVSVLFRSTELPTFSNESIVGVDLGARDSNSIVLSDGTVFKLPPIIKVLEKELEQKQKDLERKRKVNDRNWKNKKGASVRSGEAKREPTEAELKLEQEFSLLHAEIACHRRNFLQQVSAYVAANYDWVVIENLNVKGMTKSNKGTKKKPGKNRNANKAKNKAILRQGWGLFKHMLGYKMRVIEVYPAFTSMTCSKCGRKDTASRKDMVFNCTSPNCDNISHADWNAAINVLKKGLGLMEEEGVAIPSRSAADIALWQAELDLNLKEVELT